MKWGTGVRGLTRNMAILPPPSCNQEPLLVRIRDVNSQEDPLTVHCFCVYVAVVHMVGDV